MNFKSILLAGATASALGVAALGAPARAVEPAASPSEGKAADLTLASGEPLVAPAALETPIAQAQTVEVNSSGVFEQAPGWYLTVGAGAAWPSELGFRTRSLDDNLNGDLQFGGGFSIDGGLGYDFGAIRTELTYGYTRASLNEVSVSGFNPGASGIINKNDIFASAYWDIIPTGRWTPYIGGGLGYTNLSTPRFSAGDFRTGSNNRGLFGWQAKVGVSYAASYNVDVYAEGTYSGAEGFSTGNVRYDSYNDFGAKLGLRYRFGSRPVVVVEQPAPEPAPAPAPEVFTPQPAPQPMEPIRGLW
jgi:opacity protein-like surface antigen